MGDVVRELQDAAAAIEGDGSPSEGGLGNAVDRRNGGDDGDDMTTSGAMERTGEGMAEFVKGDSMPFTLPEDE